MVIFLMVVFAIGCENTENRNWEISSEVLSETIISRMHEYAVALESLDTSRVAPFYVESGKFTSYFDGQRMTRKSLLEAIENLSSTLVSFKAEWDTIEVTKLGDRSALAAASFNRTYTDTAEVTINDWGAASWIWVYEDNQWRLIHGHAVHYPNE